MSTVRFHLDGGHCTVSFAYDPELVALMKTVPTYARTWSPSTKRWHLDTEFANELADTLRRLGHHVIGLDPGSPSCSPQSDASEWAYQLFRRVGPTRQRAAFRALSRVLHPDTPTGDKQLQQELNDAHAQVAAQKGTGTA